MAPPREVMPVDVLFVGAGPASLAAAYHLLTLRERHNERVAASGGEPVPDLEVAIIEKGKAMGAHAISGAVLDPRSLRELMPDFLDQGFPFESEVRDDDVLFLTRTGSFRLPVTPPPLKNHGNYIVSISKLVRWLGEKVEEKGAFIVPEFAGREPLFEGDRVNGVRMSDKGVDKHGQQKGNFQPGADITARVTVFGEGPRGSLTKMLIRKYGLDAGKDPQVYATGVKETWKLKPGTFAKGKVVHTMGFPLDPRTFGGGFAYGCADDVLSLGFVTGLDYWHPETDPHGELQRFKTHPVVSKWLEGAEVISYGAKTIPEGGWFARPRPYFDGGLLVGDSGGFLNSMRLKGIHLAIKSGMLAAETLFEGLVKDDLSEAQLATFEDRVQKSWIKDELWGVRNFHQAMASGGLYAGMLRTGFQIAFGGRDPFGSHLRGTAGHTHMKKRSEVSGNGMPKPKYDNVRIFDKVTNVYQSGTIHEEDQPVHLQVADLDICRTKCAQEYGNPCQHFCPAAVYEMVDDPAHGGKQLHINASNCVHCKTCDVMDPYQIITWVTPEGGGGPAYKDL